MQINPVFQNALPRLTDEEFNQLEENIVSAGEVYEPITLWGEYIVDGHNRWSIIQKHPEVKYKTRQIDFESEWHALEYIYRNQMGKRNLTTQQKTYALGKLYEARKHTQGGDRRSPEFSSRTKYDLKTEPERTDEIVAREQGVHPRTVDKAYLFSKGVDQGEQDVPGFRIAVTSGQIKASKDEIGSLTKMDEERRKKSVEALLAGEKLPNNQREHEKYVQPTEEIKVGSGNYNSQDFIAQVKDFPKELESTIRLFLMAHGDMLSIEKCNSAFLSVLDEIDTVTKKYREVAKNEYRN